VRAWDPSARTGLVNIGPNLWVDKDEVIRVLSVMAHIFAGSKRASLAEAAQAAISKLQAGGLEVRPAWLAARVRRGLDLALPDDQ
jgi:hypothetical protein